MNHKIELRNRRYAFVFMMAGLVFQAKSDFSFFVKPELGILKYHLPTISLQDTAGLIDTITPVSASIAPLVRCSFGLEYDDLKLYKSHGRTSGRLGVAFESARRTNRAVRTNYLDSNLTTALLEGSQDIKNVGLLVIAEYDAFATRWFLMQLGAGLGISHAPLTELRLHQISNDAFIGQAIEPHYFNPTGYIGIGMRGQLFPEQPWIFELNYRFGLTYVDYRRKLLQSKPDTAADISAHNAYEAFQDLELVRPPHMLLYAHMFSLGIQFIF